MATTHFTILVSLIPSHLNIQCDRKGSIKPIQYQQTTINYLEDKNVTIRADFYDKTYNKNDGN